MEKTNIDDDRHRDHRSHQHSPTLTTPTPTASSSHSPAAAGGHSGDLFTAETPNRIGVVAEWLTRLTRMVSSFGSACSNHVNVGFWLPGVPLRSQIARESGWGDAALAEGR